MFEIIASILFIGSVTGVVLFIVKKMPATDQLPEKSGDFRLVNALGGAKNWFGSKIQKVPYVKDFSWIDFAQKALLRGKLVALKAENKINDYMVKLRQRAENEKKKEEALLDNYWHDLKTIVKTKKNAGKGLKRIEAETESGLEDRAVDEVSLNSVNDLAESTEKQAVLSEKSEPMIGKVVMPEQLFPKHMHNKKKHHSKKKKFRDPFKW